MNALAVDMVRFQVASSVEAPLVIDAVDWRRALMCALELLELDDRIGFLRFSRGADDEVVVHDRETGARLEIREVPLPWAAALREVAHVPVPAPNAEVTAEVTAEVSVEVAKAA